MTEVWIGGVNSQGARNVELLPCATPTRLSWQASQLGPGPASTDRPTMDSGSDPRSWSLSSQKPFDTGHCNPSDHNSCDSEPHFPCKVDNRGAEVDGDGVDVL